MFIRSIVLFIFFSLGAFLFFSEPAQALYCSPQSSTNGTCRALCNLSTETHWSASDSFCTAFGSGQCCVTTSLICLAPGTCQANQCGANQQTSPGNCSAGFCCAPLPCVAPAACQANQCAANQQPGTGTCPSGFCCNPPTPGGGGGGGGSCAAPGACQANQCGANQQTGTGTCQSGFCCVTSIPANNTTINFTSPTRYTTVDTFLLGTLGWLQGIVGMLALIFIVIGGFLYVTSGGDSGRVETAKKCITAAVIGLALALAAPSFLREISSILGWTATGPTLPGTSLSLLQIIKNVLDFLLSIVGVVGIIMLVIGGIMYMTAAGDEDRIDTGKSIVKYAIIGILVALSGLVIMTQIANFF